MNCPKCKSPNHKKNGKISGRQRYQCHDCGYNYSVEIKSTACSFFVKRQALQLYFEGYNSILRHFLERLRKKIKCYTKSIEILKYYVLLLMD